MAAYQPGEIVDITIRGARVERLTGDGVLVLNVGAEARVSLPMAAETTVERVAPAEWPPQVGDVWRGRGGLFFAVAYVPDYDDHADADGIDVEGTRVVLAREYQDYSERLGSAYCRPDAVAREHGPMTLVFRPAVTEDGAR